MVEQRLGWATGGRREFRIAACGTQIDGGDRHCARAHVGGLRLIDGTFLAPVVLALDPADAYIDRLVDVNGDGKLDLVPSTPTGFAVLLNTR